MSYKNLDGAELLTAPIDGATGTTAIVAAPGAGKRIWIRGYTLEVDAASKTYQWRSGSTVKSGAMTPGQSVVVGGSDILCDENEAANLVVESAATANGHISYSIVNV